MKVLKEVSNNCPIYNLGSDIQISLYLLAKNIANKYCVSCKFENYNDQILVDRYVPCIDKLKNILQDKHNKS